ncbi:murein biosynthesis integral membrane protein MurJ [Terrisporobacter sp.]
MSSKLARATFGLMVATIIAKILGFGRELALAAGYGTSIYSDAYVTAMNIPQVIFAIIGSTLATVLIPMYMEVRTEEGDKRALKFINNVFNLVILACIILSVLGFIFTKQIVNLFAVGYEGEALEAAINFTRITILGIVFTGLSYVMTSYLQIKNDFVTPGLSSAPKNLIIIVATILSIKFGPYLMIWGTLLGMSTEFLFQLPFAIKKGYKYEAVISLNDKYIRKMGWLVIPVLIGVAVNQINTLVDRTLASTLPVGNVSALNYSNKLTSFVIAIFITSISSVIYPMLSRLSSENNKEEFVSSVIKSVNSVIILVLPITVGSMVLALPIVRVLFQRGAFDARGTQLTALALTMYSIGMVAYGLRDVLGKIFYSLQDTKTPMINGVIAMGMNMIMDVIFVRLWGLSGLTLATSLSSLACIMLLFRSLKKRMKYYGQDKIIRATIKSLVASLIMGVVTYFVYHSLIGFTGIGGIKEFIVLGVAIGFGALVYGGLLIVFKVDEIEIVTDVLKKRLKKVS